MSEFITVEWLEGFVKNVWNMTIHEFETEMDGTRLFYIFGYEGELVEAAIVVWNDDLKDWIVEDEFMYLLESRLDAYDMQYEKEKESLND